MFFCVLSTSTEGKCFRWDPGQSCPIQQPQLSRSWCFGRMLADKLHPCTLYQHIVELKHETGRRSTNQPINREPNEPARPSFVQKCLFGVKNGHFAGREQNFCYPHIRKPPMHLVRIVFWLDLATTPLQKCFCFWDTDEFLGSGPIFLNCSV